MSFDPAQRERFQAGVTASARADTLRMIVRVIDVLERRTPLAPEDRRFVLDAMLAGILDAFAEQGVSP